MKWGKKKRKKETEHRKKTEDRKECEQKFYIIKQYFSSCRSICIYLILLLTILRPFRQISFEICNFPHRCTYGRLFVARILMNTFATRKTICGTTHGKDKYIYIFKKNCIQSLSSKKMHPLRLNVQCHSNVQFLTKKKMV